MLNKPKHYHNDWFISYEIYWARTFKHKDAIELDYKWEAICI